MSDIVDSTADEVLADTGPQAPMADMVPYHGGASTELIHAGSPDELVEKATAIATTLDRVIKGQGLRTKVGKMKVEGPNGTETWQDRYHVNVEGWQALGTLTGCAIASVTSRRLEPAVDYDVDVKHYRKGGARGDVERTETYHVHGHSWEAKVVVVRNGAIVGVGEAMRSRTEPTWARRDDFAVRSMAITRATAKAYKQAAGWIVTLAGYSATPAEEMPAEAAQPPADAGPQFGPPVNDRGLRAASAALTALCGDNEEAARAHWEAITKKAGGYMPRIVALALVAVAGPLEPSA